MLKSVELPEAFDVLEPQGFFSNLDQAIVSDVLQNCQQMLVPAGQILFRQGEPSDALYIVSIGRLDVSLESQDQPSQDQPSQDQPSQDQPSQDQPPRSIFEAGRGQIVGEMGVLTGEPRSATVRSLRDSLLLRLSRERFESLLTIHPALTRRIACSLSDRLKQSNVRSFQRSGGAKTFAVLPAGEVAPTEAFIENLTRALNAIGPTRRITKAIVNQAVGSSDMTDPRVVRWLNEQEARFSFLVYETDLRRSAWTSRCIRQADRILSVARFGSNPELNDIECSLAKMALEFGEASCCHPRINLILVHHNTAFQPSGTPEWLAGRSVDKHYHVCGNSPEDFRRLAGTLAGKAVGLVLGGGGARGFAHIGAIQAIEEAGITIGSIGGTSQGALIAAQYAAGDTPSQIARDNRAFFCGNRFYKGDITLPIYSFLRGEASNKGLQEQFGNRYISDLRLPYFCVSNDLSRAKVIVHRNDLVWKAVRCSMGLPGLMPPIVENGSLIIDGGILNNLPVDVMRQQCVGPIIGVDVSAPVDLVTESEDRESLGFLDYLRNKLTGRKSRKAVPNVIEILMRTAALSSIHHRETSIKQCDLYICPPLSGYPVLGWRHIDQLVEIGYEYTREKLRHWPGNKALQVSGRNRKEPADEPMAAASSLAAY
jgi:predicted acylesterase/phospholipase RssA/CRP-like cAMP-binding protein